MDITILAALTVSALALLGTLACILEHGSGRSADTARSITSLIRSIGQANGHDKEEK